MISSNFKEHLVYVLGCPITRILPVSGGDISKAYCIQSATDRFFCKINQSDHAPPMFLTEKLGLAEINQTNTIKAPEVLQIGQYESFSFIIMEYIESKNPTSRDMELLGQQLAQLHTCLPSDSFGWHQNNFIGSLPQSNKRHTDWSVFYALERLLPQLNLAMEKRLLDAVEIPSGETLITGTGKWMSAVKPAVLHGDLWGGNYLINTQGVPYLIDPAVYFGHHEVDIAMTRLFGGFSARFYEAYYGHIPAEPQQKERNDIYQLYYLLVHLNLFGRSYYARVKKLLETYFGQRHGTW